MVEFNKTQSYIGATLVVAVLLTICILALTMRSCIVEKARLENMDRATLERLEKSNEK